MKVGVEVLDSVRKKIEVIVPEEEIKLLHEKIYDEIKRQAKLKGFRQGKVPRAIILSYYKDYIEDELKKRMLQTTMYKALKEANVTPVTEPIVDFLEDGGLRGYVLECEVIPEIELPEYKGVEVEVEPISISEEEIKDRIEKIRQMHAEMNIKEEGKGAEKGDFVVISYQGFMNGKPVKDVKTDAYPIELGSSSVMPEFENAIYGIKKDEDREITIDFPDDYPNKEIAGKKILFKIHAKEVREKIIPELDDDFAKDAGFENIEKMEEGIRKVIENEKDAAKKKEISQKIIENLLNGLDIPVPRRYLEKRIEGMLEDAKGRFEKSALTDEALRSIEENLRKDFQSKAETRIKTDILLAKIAEKEGIKLADDDVEDRIKRIAEDSKRAYNEVMSFYEKNNLIEGLKNIILEEKTLNMLRENAVVKEKS